MRKTQTTLYLPVKVIDYLEQQARGSSSSKSALAASVLTSWMNQKKNKQGEHNWLTCPTCGDQYMEKMGDCPWCQTDRLRQIEQEQLAEQETENSKKLKRLQQSLKSAREYLERLKVWRKKDKATDKEVSKAENKVEKLEKKIADLQEAENEQD